MAKGFFDIKTAEPPPIPEDSNALVQAEHKRQQAAHDREQAAPLKEKILEQLEAGTAPQLILYTALDAIGTLTNDPDFTTTAQGKLEAVYKDLAQQSMFQDNDEIARERLTRMQTEYNDKLRRDISRKLAGCRRIEQALNDVMRAVNSADTPPDKLDTPVK